MDSVMDRVHVLHAAKLSSVSAPVTISKELPEVVPEHRVRHNLKHCWMCLTQNKNKINEIPLCTL